MTDQPTTTETTTDLELAHDWLERADSLFLTSGAGLTAAAGIDYGDTELFARHFPGMLQYGVRAQYEMIGRPPTDEALFWGYWANHVNLVRHTWDRAEPYDDLHRLAGTFDDDEVFVMTSNVDGFFERRGFDPARIHTPQGDYALMQCETPCTRDVWTWKDELDAMVDATDPATQRLRDPALVPRCPNCGGPVFMNVRKDASFIDDHWRPAADRMAAWLRERATGNGLIIEIGAGFNTPSVIRWPGEAITDRFEGWRLLRINPTHPDVPAELGERAHGVSTDAGAFLRTLAG